MDNLSQILGLTLLHYLWQGTAIAMVTAIALEAFRTRSAHERYVIAMMSLGTMLLAPLCTFLGLASKGQATGAAPAWLDSLEPVPPSVLTILAILWATGFTVTQFRLLLNWKHLSELGRTASVSVLPESWISLCRELSDQLGVKCSVRLLHSAQVSVPTTFGWLRPMILLPLKIVESLTPDEVRAVLAHELAHIRRHDYLANLMQSLAESVLFFHPATWWISRRIRNEREYCCDDIASRLCTSRVAYARALSSLETLRNSESSLALASNGGSLMDRISRLFDSHSNAASGRLFVPIASVCGLALALSLTGLGCGESSETTAPSSTDELSSTATELGLHEDEATHAGAIVELLDDEGNIQRYVLEGADEESVREIHEAILAAHPSIDLHEIHETLTEGDKVTDFIVRGDGIAADGSGDISDKRDNVYVVRDFKSASGEIHVVESIESPNIEATN